MAVRTILVRVKPRSRVTSLALMADGTWLARIRSPPIDGKANHELIALLAERFRCPKGLISIKSGESARKKLVRIETA